MRQTIRVAPANSLLFVMDPSIGRVPDSLHGIVGMTRTCVAVGTRCSVDGDTSVTLTDEPCREAGLRTLFEGTIDIDKQLAVRDVAGNCLLAASGLWEQRLGLVIYGDDDSEPETLIVSYTTRERP